MKAVIGFFKNKWVIQFIGVAALSVLIWFVGPLIAIAGKELLASEWVRGGTIASIVVFWVIYRLLMQIRAGRKDQQLMAELAGAEPGKMTEAAGEEEIDQLRKKFEEALGVLRDSRAKGKRDKQFLYELPWYVIIGPPGVGKTVALRNSGLHFPLEERLGKDPVKGIGGTRNCDWWFTDEAVLIDTAGRWTTQDSHQAVDAAAWHGFLELLKKHRAHRPLNGVLLAISMSDLMQQTEEERLLNATAVRRRVAEIYQILGIRLPVYLLLTKCDLVAGFTDFFADLHQEERGQVWGETFPAEDNKHPGDFLDTFDSAYEEILQRLDRRTFRRILDERDIHRRTAILEFPQQMALQKPAIMAFLRDAFGATRYETPTLLRGIYFTSGTQEGSPIDRVMGILAATFHLNRQSAPVYSGRGKSYFLTRLLRDVVFSESELAGVDPQVERRQRLMQLASYAAAGLFTIGVLALWALSYSRNQWALARVGEQIDRYPSAASAEVDWESSMRALLPKMRTLREARDVYASSGWSMHMGLYQGNKIERALDGVYEKVLQNQLLRLVKVRLEQRMAGTEGDNPDLLYELLRVYLMLGEPRRLETAEARDAAENLIRVDWVNRFSHDPEALAEMSVHLHRLLQLPPEPVALNNDLVAGARARLTNVDEVVQAYGHFRNSRLGEHAYDLRLGEVLGKLGGEVFVATGGQNVAGVTVPGLFTAKGYREYFLKGADEALKESLREDWVLGKERSIDPAELASMRINLEKLYLNDYRKTWLGLLSNVQLRGGGTLSQTANLLGILSKKDSPLRVFLEMVEQNTTLSRVSASVAADLAAQLGVKADGGKMDPRLEKALNEAKKAAGVGDVALDPARTLVEQYFEDLNRQVRKKGDQPAPLDEVQETIKELHAAALQAQSGGSPKPGGGGAASQAAAKLKDLPPQIKNPLSGLAASIGKQTDAQIKTQLNALLQSGVIAPCKAALGGRYPFVRNSSQEVALADFAKFFSANGVMDGFFQTNLKDLVDTSRTEWRTLPGVKQSIALSQGMIAQFQNAAVIRDAFFPPGAPGPKFQFDLRPISLDNTVASFSLNIEGQEISNQHGPEQVGSFQWPGPAPNKGVRMVFKTLDGRELGSPAKQGPWALLRLLDESSLQPTSDPVRFHLTFQVGGFHAQYELSATSVQNPFNLDALRNFRCPEGL